MPVAVAVVAPRYGGPEVLETRRVEVASPGPGEVLVDVRAAGLNPIDAKQVSGAMGADEALLPRRLGREAAGVVAEVGPGGADGPRGPLAVGDEVVVYPASGTWATRVVVPGSSCVPRPPDLTWEVAGGMMVTGVTAVHLLEATSVGRGDVVLVHGAAGGVGRTVVQLALARGAARVIATAREANHAALRELGAEPITYGDGLLGRLRERAPDGITVALDCAGTDEAVDVSVALVADRERIATIVPGPHARQAGIRLLGGGPGADPGTELRARARLQVVDAVASGALRLEARAYPLADAATAVRDNQRGGRAGKVVLVP